MNGRSDGGQVARSGPTVAHGWRNSRPAFAISGSFSNKRCKCGQLFKKSTIPPNAQMLNIIMSKVIKCEDCNMPVTVEKHPEHTKSCPESDVKCDDCFGTDTSLIICNAAFKLKDADKHNCYAKKLTKISMAHGWARQIFFRCVSYSWHLNNRFVFRKDRTDKSSVSVSFGHPNESDDVIKPHERAVNYLCAYSKNTGSISGPYVAWVMPMEKDRQFEWIRFTDAMLLLSRVMQFDYSLCMKFLKQMYEAAELDYGDLFEESTEGTLDAYVINDPIEQPLQLVAKPTLPEPKPEPVPETKPATRKRLNRLSIPTDMPAKKKGKGSADQAACDEAMNRLRLNVNKVRCKHYLDMSLRQVREAAAKKRAPEPSNEATNDSPEVEWSTESPKQSDEETNQESRPPRSPKVTTKPKKQSEPIYVEDDDEETDDVTRIRTLRDALRNY